MEASVLKDVDIKLLPESAVAIAIDLDLTNSQAFIDRAKREGYQTIKGVVVRYKDEVKEFEFEEFLRLLGFEV